MLDRFVRRALLGAFAFGVVLTTHQEARAGGSCVPGFNYGAFSKDCTMKFAGGAVTDSYDSGLGTYTSTVTNTGGNIGTNGSSAGCVSLNGTTTDINGTIDVGPGGTASTVGVSGGAHFDNEPNPNVLTSTLSLPSVVVPTVGTNQGNQSCNSNCSLAPNQTYGQVKITAGAILTLSSGEYVMSQLSLAGNAGINLNITSGPIIIYITSDLDISGGTITNPTNQSTNLVFMVAATCANVKLSGGAQASYACYAPDSDIQLTGGGEIFGAVVGKTVVDTGGSKIHYDKALATTPIGQFSCAANEVSRASPVIATIGGVDALVQGTFETPTTAQTSFSTVAQLSSWTFPFYKGHMRARTASAVSAGSFSTGTIFDAGATGKIPAGTACTAINGSCRYLFTNTNTPAGRTFLPTIKEVSTANAATIGPLLTSGLTGFGTTEWTTIIQKIRDAKLGGVDRSTVAVIEAGTIVGSTRAKMAYFGATDGMLHAVCMDTAASYCPSTGTELWAFMPRVQLPLVRDNTTRIDGSVRVLDVFGNFPSSTGSGTPVNTPSNPTGRRAFRTILLFNTGFGIGTKDAAYALDITDPQKPIVIWEYATPASPAAIDFGTAMTVGAGPTVIDGQAKNLAVFETNNAGTTATTKTAVVATAIDIDTGTLTWQFTHEYKNPPRGDATAAMPLPPHSVPGGAVPIDISNAGLGLVTHYVFGDLYGSVWRLDAVTGKPPLTGDSTDDFVCTHDPGTGVISDISTCVPIFKFVNNKKPIGGAPAVFARTSGGEQYLGFASGGYVDPVATIWSDNSQKLMAIKLSPSTIPTSDAVAASTTGDVLVNLSFTTALDKAFSSALIVGTKLLVTADNTDVNLSSYGTSGSNTGHVYSIDIAGGALSGTVTSTTTTFQGAGQVAYGAAASKAFAGTGESFAATTTGGVSVDPSSSTKLTRRLWVRSTL